MRNARAHKLQWSGPTVHSSTLVRIKLTVWKYSDSRSNKFTKSHENPCENPCENPKISFKILFQNQNFKVNLADHLGR